MKVDFPLSAAREFEEAIDWYAGRSRRAEEGFRAVVRKAIQLASDSPGSAGFLVGKRSRKIALKTYRYGLSKLDGFTPLAGSIGSNGAHPVLGSTAAGARPAPGQPPSAVLRHRKSACLMLGPLRRPRPRLGRAGVRTRHPRRGRQRGRPLEFAARPDRGATQGGFGMTHNPGGSRCPRIGGGRALVVPPAKARLWIWSGEKGAGGDGVILGLPVGPVAAGPEGEVMAVGRENYLGVVHFDAGGCQSGGGASSHSGSGSKASPITIACSAMRRRNASISCVIRNHSNGFTLPELVRVGRASVVWRLSAFRFRVYARAFAGMF